MLAALEQSLGLGGKSSEILSELVSIHLVVNQSERVIRLLEKVIWFNGKPKNIRCDNGPEFISKVFQEWCKGNDINIIYIQPGHPTQNSIIERFNGSYRRAVLYAYIFRTFGISC